MGGIRFEALLEPLRGSDVLYDIGTDHARLPILALERGYIRRAVAVDNKPLPLESARRHIAAAGLSDRIETVLAEGLDALTDTCDVAVTAGLGGRTIHKIFSGADTKGLTRFVFQPANRPERVRDLCDEGFEIIDETLVEDGGMDHIVIVCIKGRTALSAKERLFGPILLKKKPLRYHAMLLERSAHLKKLLEKMPAGENRRRFVEELTAVEEVLYEWQDDQNVL